MRTDQEMNVIRHDRKRVQRIAPQHVRIVKKDLDNHVRNDSLPQIKRTRTGLLKQPIQYCECSARAD